MTTDDRVLIQHLFTLATEILEDTHITASAGQSLERRPAQLMQYVEVLRAAARDLDASAHAILAVLNKNIRTP